MLKKPMPRAKTILLLLTAVLLAGCALDDQTPAPPATEPPVSISRPPYILDVSPLENSSVSHSLYYLADSDLRVGMGSPEYGFFASVCVDFDLAPLVEKGDDFIDTDRVDERIELVVDGVTMEPCVERGFDQLTRHVMGSPQNPEAQWGGPLLRCWRAPVRSGIHEALFRFRKTSGDYREYSWSFTITRR